MKKFIIALLVAACAFTSCKKSTPPFDPVKQAAADDAAIQAYIKANNITATKDPSGLYYQITNQGTGVNPTATSIVTVNYTGKLLNGTVFDSSTLPGQTVFTSPLSVNGVDQVVAGWVIGVPLVKAGGSILLIIPSALGYGNAANGSIPANSVLVFNIDLISVR